MSGIRRFLTVTAASGIMAIGVAGCMHDRPESLSGSAVLAVEGSKTLSYTASADGMATVFDSNTDHIVYAGRIMKGQNLMVDVPNDKITLNGQVVSESALPGGDNYRVFFEPNDHIDRTATVETNSVETVHSDH